jgi:DNA segregation ATPase FtsK/SpoIIIE-like protein
MEIVTVEIQPRRDPFADVPEIGKLLDEHGYLSVSLVQRKLRMGYTSAARWLDFLVEVGELELNEETHRYTSRRTKRAPDEGQAAQ